MLLKANIKPGVVTQCLLNRTLIFPLIPDQLCNKRGHWRANDSFVIDVLPPRFLLLLIKSYIFYRLAPRFNHNLYRILPNVHMQVRTGEHFYRNGKIGLLDAPLERSKISSFHYRKVVATWNKHPRVCLFETSVSYFTRQEL